MAANDDAQNLFEYFDTYWFTHQIFKKTQKNPFPQTHINHQESIVETEENTLDFQDNIDYTNDSPNSVLNLYSPKLETIFSGKEILEEKKEPVVAVKMNKKASPKERKKNSSSGKKSKSLSELEFEELKGFMDLGFMFSEKDKDSNKLVSIIPGLQRLGKSDSTNTNNKDDDDVVSSSSRPPYLSEAWDNYYEFDNKRELIRIPAAFGNEIEIKDQLKCWAHSVAASVVR